MDLVLTLIGADRPGLVDALSRTVLFHGANWLDSQMAQLGGQFAGILRLSVEEERVDDLVRALEELEGEGLKVVVAKSPGEERGSSDVLRLELLSQDRPGIVRHLATALAQRGVDVERLETRTESAAMSGERLFRATAWLSVPADVSPGELREALDAVGSDLMADITLDDEPIET